MNEDCYNIEIYTDDNPEPSLLDQLRDFKPMKKPTKSVPVETEDEPLILSKVIKKQPKNKKKKKSELAEACSGLDVFGEYSNSDGTEKSQQDIDEDTLLDIESILNERDEVDDDIEDELTTQGKRSYKNLKKDKNNYRKEFAEELTLLYSLLDETSKFGKNLEKDLSSLKGSKVRGVSKYTNELAELVLSSKQSKLNILKEINATKKMIADLTLKSETKTKDTEGKNNPEYLASVYFKNILNHGRGEFIDTLSGGGKYSSDSYNPDMDDNDRYDDDDEYDKILTERLEVSGNPFRSDAASKYIEYENMGVKIYVNRCIDTNEWEFIAIDKHGQRVDDYPVPTRREVGRMKFSDDHQYATDSKGRIYNVKDYFLDD